MYNPQTRRLTETHCNTLQYADGESAKLCRLSTIIGQEALSSPGDLFVCVCVCVSSPRCNSLQHTATHCTTLQHTTICVCVFMLSLQNTPAYRYIDIYRSIPVCRHIDTQKMCTYKNTPVCRYMDIYRSTPVCRRIHIRYMFTYKNNPVCRYVS